MSILRDYEQTKDDISAINNKLAEVLKPLDAVTRRPVDRINELALVLLSIFAFESLCWDCIREVEGPEAGRFGSKLMPALEAAAKKCKAKCKIDQVKPDLSEIMQIRNLYAHGVGRRRRGRRRSLDCPASLPADVLTKYAFESDSCAGCTECCDSCQKTDDDTQWWPSSGEDGSFARIGAVLLCARDIVIDALGCRGV